MVGGDAEESPRLNKPGEEITNPERSSGDLRGLGGSRPNKPRGMGAVREGGSPAHWRRSALEVGVVTGEHRPDQHGSEGGPCEQAAPDRRES